jgi:ribonuclease P protein component
MERLSRNSDFLRIKNHGISFKQEPFWLQIDNRQGLTRKLGIIATKRLGNAVCRNKAKRLVRELYRKSKDMLPNSCQIVVVPKKPIFKTDFTYLEASFKQTLVQAAKRL